MPSPAESLYYLIDYFSCAASADNGNFIVSFARVYRSGSVDHCPKTKVTKASVLLCHYVRSVDFIIYFGGGRIISSPGYSDFLLLFPFCRIRDAFADAMVVLFDAGCFHHWFFSSWTVDPDSNDLSAIGNAALIDVSIRE